MEEKKKKKKKFFSVIGEILLWVLAIFFVSTSATNIIDSHTNYGCSYFGYRVSVIVSESMQYRNPENSYLTDNDLGQIAKYDVITAKEVGYEEIEIYDVVLHVDEAGLICHRVVDKYESDGVNYLVTRGDSNNLDDAPFAYSSFRGKVINVVPKIGQVVLFMQSGYFLLAIFLSVFVVSGLCFLFSYLDKRGDKKTVVTSNEETPASSLDITSKEETGKKITINRHHVASSSNRKHYRVIRRTDAPISSGGKRYRVERRSKQKKGVSEQ